MHIRSCEAFPVFRLVLHSALSTSRLFFLGDLIGGNILWEIIEVVRGEIIRIIAICGMGDVGNKMLVDDEVAERVSMRDRVDHTKNLEISWLFQVEDNISKLNKSTGDVKSKTTSNTTSVPNLDMASMLKSRGFGSRLSIIRDVTKAAKDYNIHFAYMCGMGGVGIYGSGNGYKL
ncbi:hypothetical protein LguiB_013781 [Lonicera macranthoides]